MKIGIIGAGGIAKAHAKALSTVKGAELSGFLISTRLPRANVRLNMEEPHLTVCRSC